METSSGNSGRKEGSFCFLYFLKRNGKKSAGGSWRRFGWWKKRGLFSKSSSSSSSSSGFHSRIVDSILFKIASGFESVVLVSAVCFFFLCCGCHF
ncbi:hypothetical protein DCAR_0208931 [Daucus carota subsp. sativus]|uniref:Uncharacterized protein n=1 Tax=Daucus carota subsp. sativus TaxID=79200 RepID=A0A166EWJ8_DAUCS|nr:hypothetical protein DCAR_0208931 [Daucus carota subsp. sativus]